MCAAVNKNNVILAQLDRDAAKHVKYNTNILAHLIDLLPGHYLEQWFDHKVDQEVYLGGGGDGGGVLGPSGNLPTNPTTDWELFNKWLRHMEKRANAQKLAKLSKADSGNLECCGPGQEMLDPAQDEVDQT